MHNINIRLVNIPDVGASKLKFAKIIKDFAGLPLRDAKDFCDKVMEHAGVNFNLNIKEDPMLLKSALPDTGMSFLVEDRIELRQKKLISLGIGDNMDKIDFLSRELSNNLLVDENSQINSKFYIYKSHFEEVLFYLNSEQLDKFINNISKKDEQEN